MRLLRQLLPLITAAIVLTGCGASSVGQIPAAKPDAATASATSANAFATLRQTADKYLQGTPSLSISAQEVYEKAVLNAGSGYYLVDVRSDEHYAQNYIPGAVHISYADVWRNNKTDYLPKDKKIVVIDYSGHSSSQVAAYWSLLGFDATAMKHGMAGWSKDKEVIGGSPLPCEPRNFAVVKEDTAVRTFELPALEIKAVRADELLRQRGEAVSAKPVVIQADDLLARVTSRNVFVLDIRTAENFKAGHIAGAVNLPLRTLAEEANLKKLPPDQQIVVVDYDGHSASQAARLLNLLGYDSVALRDGMSVWTGDVNALGAGAIACNIPERATAQLNAPLNPGPSTAAT